MLVMVLLRDSHLAKDERAGPYVWSRCCDNHLAEDKRAGAYVWSWCCDVTITSLMTRELVPMFGHGVLM